MRHLVAAAFGLLGIIGSNPAHAQDYVRGGTESDFAFAKRVLHLNADSDAHVLAAAWNSVPTVFVDYQVDQGGQTLRPLVALMRQKDGRYSLIHVTEGEEEGAVASFDAIGFADADHSGAKALIALLSWDQNHHELVSGKLYEVRLFSPPKPGQTQLKPMTISSHFDGGCECTHEDGPKGRPYKTHYRFRTIAAVRTELKRMGY